MATENDNIRQTTVAVDGPSTRVEDRTAVDERAAAGRRARRRPQWWIWGVALALVLLGVFIRAEGTRPTSTTATQRTGMRPGMAGGRGSMIPPVTGVVARQGDMPVYLNGLGSVTSLNTVTVRSRVDGQLMSVNFTEGQLVRKGELLAQIDPRPFQVQLTQAEGQAAKDAAALKNAQLDVQRYQALLSQDAIPRQTYDTSVATLNQVEGALKSDQGAIENAKLNLTYSRITAPATGRIGLRQVDPGNIVRANDQNGIVTITERQPIGVLFTISEDQLPPVLKQMHGGQPLVVEAWDRDLTTRLATGRLLTVDNAIDQTTGTVRLKAQFANEDDALFPNQFVNARLLLDMLRGVVIVPTAAVQRNQQATFVYLVSPDNKVEVRNVTVQITEGDSSAIASGLQPGDRVITEGVDRLQPGMTVTMRLPGGDNGTVRGAAQGGTGRGNRGQTGRSR